MKKNPLMDIIDIHRQLEIEFPHVKLDIGEDIQNNNARTLHGQIYYRFKLSRLFNEVFEPSIKTNIWIPKDYYLTPLEFHAIRLAMEESFNKQKLYGLN